MKPLLSKPTYTFFLCLLGLVYVAGLFVPLMDNDSAHHADIALHMYLNRDYVNLVDAGKDYLDKPHLLFWLCAFSYKIFGVTTFAFKFPSFCFTILGLYSTFRLGKALHDEEAGRLATLMLASTFAFVLANNDVRMDAILTACVAFASWQGAEFVQRGRLINGIGLALGLALGFSTKGHIAVFTVAVGLLFYLAETRRWKFLLNWKWLVVLVSFLLLIAPVVYCYYCQFNLHPERGVRGRDHINGVRFILFGQSVERFEGSNFGGGTNDFSFFFHTFLWAFAPWSVLAYMAVWSGIKNFVRRRADWLPIATFIAILVILTFSRFKLPHYVNVIFPATTVMAASWLMVQNLRARTIYLIQLIVCFLILVAVAIINAWAFPIDHFWVVLTVVLLLAVVFYFSSNKRLNYLQRAVGLSVATLVLSFFTLNINFYPKLLKYQGGFELAKKIKGSIDPANVYFWKDNYSSSFNFYTATERKQFDDSIFLKGKRPIWLLFDKKNMAEIGEKYRMGHMDSVPDFEITRLTFKFINPTTRNGELTQLVVAEIFDKN